MSETGSLILIISGIACAVPALSVLKKRLLELSGVRKKTVDG